MSLVCILRILLGRERTNDLLFKAFAKCRGRGTILNYCHQVDGGQFESTLLRRIYAHYYGISVGMYSYGGCFNHRQIPRGTIIGRYGSFADFWVFGRNHPSDFISMHPYFYNKSLGKVKEDKVATTPLVIGHGVWIGQGVYITPSVASIGDGSIVGCGSVLTNNVPEYSVVAGNPAKFVRMRFSGVEIDAIKCTKWWEKPFCELEPFLALFTKPTSIDDLTALQAGLSTTP